MKNFSYLLLLMVIYSSFVNAQDKIFLKSGENIEAIVIEVNLIDIKYKKFSNPEGPLRTLNKDDIHMVLYKNGESEIFDAEKTISLEETKAVIIEYMNKYAYSYKTGYKFDAIFEGDYLELTRITKIAGRPPNRSSKLYDFSGDCTFHRLSNRNTGISYVNVYVNYVQIKKSKTEKRKHLKFVIAVKGHENGKILRDALIRYNEYFQ